MDIPEYELVVRAVRLREIDKSRWCHLGAWLHIPAKAEKKAGKNRKKPVYDSFRKFFDYDKYLRQEGGAAPHGQNALSRLSRHMKETSENGTEL